MSWCFCFDLDAITLAFLKTTADLNKKIVISSSSSNAHLEPGNTLKLKCTLPNSHPRPRITWQKNGHDLLTTAAKNDVLIIQSVRVSDSGDYTCTAENIVGKRISDKLKVMVTIDGNKRHWTEWTVCGRDCRKTRSRNCNEHSFDSCDGQEVESMECYDGNCQPFNNRRPIAIIILLICVISVASFYAHYKLKKRSSNDYVVTFTVEDNNGELLLHIHIYVKLKKIIPS